MKKVIFLAAAFYLAACSTEDDMMTQYNDNVVRIGSATVVRAVQSRVNSIDNGDSFEDSDEILLVNESRNDLNKDVYAYKQLAWTAKGDGVYWKIGRENNFKAYYPANQNTLDIQDQSSVEKLSLADWMEASASAKKGNDISLSFSHQRAKVIINCNFSGYEGKTITMTEQKIFNGYSITPYCSKNQLIAILCPYSYSDGDKFIELNVNGLTYTAYVNDFLKTTGLEKGKVYTFTMTITNKEMTISTVDVKDWTGKALEEVQAIAAIVDASNHSIRTYEQNQLNNDLVKKAFGEGTELSIVGPMGDTDFAVLKNYLNSLDNSSRISLDLSDANVTEIPNEAFRNVKTISTIKLPKTVRTIKDFAFRDCSNLNVLNLSELNSLEEIGKRGFGSIKSIDLTDEVILPSSITTIGNGAFEYCKSKSITIPEHVTNIAKDVFIYSSLENIIIKSDLKSPDGGVALDTDCFTCCESLKSIDLSACTTVPTTNANGLPVDFVDGNSNFTIYVKDEIMKTKFEADDFFKNFTISVKE